MANDIIKLNAVVENIGRNLSELSHRIFHHLEDEASVRKVQTLLEAFDNQFHPGQTAFQVYGQLLGSHSGHNGADRQSLDP